jgi:hypothetical protein
LMNNMNNAISEIQSWYHQQCNGEWEHSHGITIETIDNPGWSVQIALAGTSWEKSNWDVLIFDHSPADWINCAKNGSEFKGFGDPSKLEKILNHFFTQISRSK